VLVAGVAALLVTGCRGTNPSSERSGPLTTLAATTTIPTTAAEGTTTTAGATTTGDPYLDDPIVQARGGAQFLTQVRGFKATDSDASLLSLGYAACENAKSGREDLESYHKTTVEPTLAASSDPADARRDYIALLRSAAVKLCTLQFEPMILEAHRLEESS